MEFSPHSYQYYCIQRIIDDEAVGLFLRPGLGKTVITLTAFNELIRYRWRIRKCLVIAPKKVAEGTWSKEASKWNHLEDLKVATVLGSVSERVKALESPANVYVINRENVPWLVEKYKHDWPFDGVVIDESTSFKNSSSKRFRALKQVRKYISKIVLLSGTPSSHGIEDLWAQIYLLDQGQRLGKTLSAYRAEYFIADVHGGHFTTYTAKPGAESAVLAAISDICVTMRAEDYLDLPACIEQEIPVILDAKTKREYDLFERNLLLQVDEDVITAGTAGVLTGKLLQYCSGAIYDENKNVVHIHDCKLEAFKELLEEIDGEHCIVFYGFQHDKDRILAALSKSNLRIRVYEGVEDEEDWNAGNIDLLLVHPSSCAYGLNLQAGGRHIIWFTPNWSFELNDQGKCRLWRQGTPYDKVFVHYLVVQGCVDEDVLSSVQNRESTHNNVMHALKARIKRVRECSN